MSAPLLLMLTGAALTIYFTYEEYKKGLVSKRHFTTIAVLEALVIVIGLIMLLKELLSK